MPADDNIEPVARAISERICRRIGMTDEAEVASWVERHWECAAAELEGGTIDEDGNNVPDADWERGLAAYRQRLVAKRGDA